MQTEIYIISHKEIALPKNELYLPIQVGSKKKRKRFKRFLQDDAGENIAFKNPHYCELTAQYWAWKNRPAADIQGIVHYRRFFANSLGKNQVITTKPFDHILQADFLAELLSKYDLTLPPKRYFLEPNLWLHYRFQHRLIGLKVAQEVITQKFPAYTTAFDQVIFHQRSAHMYNMFIARRSLFCAYSAWIFAVLQETEARIDIRNFLSYEQRIFGFLSEFLLNVWVKKNQLNFVEVPVIMTQHRNYPAEACQYLQRRINQGRKNSKIHQVLKTHF